MYNHKTYLLNVAEKLKELQHTEDDPHFHRIYGLADIEELIANQTITSGYQLLMEENDDNRFIDNNSDNILNRDYYAFYVAKNYEGGDFDSKETAKERCKTVAKKIISKYLKDYKEDRSSAPDQVYGLFALEPGSFSMRTIGPLGDNYIAIFVSFTIISNPKIIYNAGDWNE